MIKAMPSGPANWFSRLIRNIRQFIRELAKLAWNTLIGFFGIVVAIGLIGKIVSLFDGGTSQPTSQETSIARTAPDRQNTSGQTPRQTAYLGQHTQVTFSAIHN
jgi:hypothetical protein